MEKKMVKKANWVVGNLYRHWIQPEKENREIIVRYKGLNPFGQNLFIEESTKQSYLLTKVPELEEVEEGTKPQTTSLDDVNEDSDEKLID